MNISRLAAFSDGNAGGNPAGVALLDVLPPAHEMQAMAAQIGYSESVFACPENDGWRVRYFAPEMEVPFCGHATIALGAEMAAKYGSNTYKLYLNETSISVEAAQINGELSASLQSPETYSKAADAELLNAALSLFGYTEEQLDSNLPIALAHAGANHLIIGLNSRKDLASMSYEFEAGKKLMNSAGLITVLLAYAETPHIFHTRNPFASGGIYEDPATGAATAALAGYLRDLNWPHDGRIDIVQGEDMGCRSLLAAEISPEKGSSIRVSGAARYIN